MSQPPLSQQIKRLEAEIGLRLLERTTRQVSLTAAGGVFLREARGILGSVDSSVRLARQAAAGESGVIRLGMSGQGGYEVMSLLLRKFRESFPGMFFDIVMPLYRVESVQRILNHDLDVGILALPVPTNGLEVRELVQQRLVMAVPINHNLAKFDSLETTALSGERTIRYPVGRGSVIEKLVEAACVQQGVSPYFVQEAPDTHTLLQLVGAGVGVGVVPESAAAIQVSGVKLIPLTDTPLLSLGLVWRAGDPSPALANLVRVGEEIQANG
jgi:DNA-binding transcriptional LysR family regulator